jgi:hypothetical protein
LRTKKVKKLGNWDWFKNPFVGTKEFNGSVLKDYEDFKFIDKVTNDFVDFVMRSRPPLLAAINIPNYEKRTHLQEVTKHIPRADAKWLGERLSQVSEEQIRDAFRAGGYTQEEVEGYSAVIQNRIAALNAL